MSTYKLQGPLTLVGDDTAMAGPHGGSIAYGGVAPGARVFDGTGRLVLNLERPFQFAIWQRIKASAASTGLIQDADLDDLLLYDGSTSAVARFGNNPTVLARSAEVNA